MLATKTQPRRSLKRLPKRRVKRIPRPVVSELIRFTQGDRLVGTACLDDQERVLACDASVPRDVVFRALIAYTRRHQLMGAAASRTTGQSYAWEVVDEDEF
jgi:hypothetical protein